MGLENHDTLGPAHFKGEIINGKKAVKNSLQYMASMQLDGKHYCGGFLISEKFILSAAHCDKPGNISVILGTHNIKSNQGIRVSVVLSTNLQTIKMLVLGDSGGPLVCNGMARGIVSFNFHKNCDYPNLPNVYINVSKFLPWIRKTIKNAS
ncbi:mast cell protease 8-like [Brienomyrus brachyistius]|uniref:mast cell protease 8-like n=1 Tax=Brienomyrus brachyistius TaxID=42636 RepID=UPI0020B17CB9|nr:mast cell protease 8-like [Brienomyrus brachyistius]